MARDKQALVPDDQLESVQAECSQVRDDVNRLLAVVGRQQAQLDVLLGALVALGNDIRIKQMLDFPAATALEAVSVAGCRDALQASRALAEPVHPRR